MAVEAEKFAEFHRMRGKRCVGSATVTRATGALGAPVAGAQASSVRAGEEVSSVSERPEGLPARGGEQVLCRVCLKPVRSDERRWLAHYRGIEYPVCCPSCVQLFNRDPQQFVEEG